MLNAIGDDNFGLYSFVTSITAWMTVITTALASAYVRFSTIENQQNGSSQRVTSIFFKIFSIFSIVLLLIGCILLFSLRLAGFELGNYTSEQNDVLYVLFFLSTINVSLTIFFNVFNLQLTYLKKFVLLRLFSVLSALSTVIFNIVVPLFTDSIVVLVLFYVGATLVNGLALLILMFASRTFSINRVSLRENKVLVRQILVFSSFVLLNSIVDQINANLDKTILGVMVNSSAVTLYQLGHTFNTSLTAMSTSISSVFVPRINQLVVQGKKDEINSLFLRVSKIQLFILCLIVGGFFACGYDFVLWWIGEGRIAVFGYAAALTLLTLVPLSVNLGIEVQRAMNLHKFRAYLYFALALLNAAVSTLLVWLLPDEYAIWGCIVGTVIANISGIWIILNIYNFKVIGLPMLEYAFSVVDFVGSTLPCVAISLFLGQLVDFEPLLSFIIEGVIFVLFFALMFNDDLTSLLKNLFRRKKCLGRRCDF